MQGNHLSGRAGAGDWLRSARAALPRGRTLPLPLWERRHRWMIWLLWSHIPIITAVGIVYSGYSLGHSVLHGLPIAAFACLSLVPAPRRIASVIVASGLLTCSAVLVHVTEGLIESHFHFFVVMAILTLYEDWAPYALAFAYVGLHHGAFGTISPEHVYSHGGSAWGWALVHAGFIAAAGAANVVSWRMNEAVRAHAAAEGRGRQRAEAVASTLRESLIPEPIPELDDARVAVRYRTGEGEIGGDWFEVLELSNGCIGVALGDVAGRGVSAAVLTAKLRHTLRAYASEGMAPSEILARLDRIADASFATVAYAVICPETEAVTIASAGHPPPIVITADGRARFADRVQSPPLVGLGGPFVETEFKLPTGSSLLLYTDGLYERRNEDVGTSLERLRDFADGLTEPPEALCSRLLFGLNAGSGDDTALVALQTVRPATETTVTVPAAPEHVAALRRAAAKWSRAAGVAAEAVDGVAVAVSEAAANAIEHSGTDTVEMHLRQDGNWAEYVVRDFGRWREQPPMNHPELDYVVSRGRGLLLMSAFCDVTVDPRPDGTRITLRVPREITDSSRSAAAGPGETLARSG